MFCCEMLSMILVQEKASKVLPIKKEASMGAFLSSSIMSMDMKDFHSLYYSLFSFQSFFQPLTIDWPFRFSGRLSNSDVLEKGFIIKFFAFSKLLLKIFSGLP